MATEIVLLPIPYAGKTGAITTFGAVPTAAGNWFYCKHPSRTFILLENKDAAARTMTLIGQKTNPQTGVVTNEAHTIAIGNITTQYLTAPVDEWLIDEGGKIHMTWDAVANVLIGIYTVGAI